MIRHTLKIIPISWLLCLVLTVSPAPASEHPTRFAFVDANFVITAELADDHTFIVNFINLSDFVVVIQPSDFIYRTVSGSRYIGQVYELEHQDPMGEMQRYTASILLRGHSFAGLNVVGLFLERDQIEELSVRVGSHRFFLAPLEKDRFEQLARRIEKLDLDSADVEEMYRETNIQKMGLLKNTDGSDAWDSDWEGLITPEGVNPPKAIETPAILIPENAKKSEEGYTVRISCLITKNGGIQNLKVVKSRDHNLDQRALDGVANSWIFLPATRNGEVFETVIQFDVAFVQPPGPEQ